MVYESKMLGDLIFRTFSNVFRVGYIGLEEMEDTKIFCREIEERKERKRDSWIAKYFEIARRHRT